MRMVFEYEDGTVFVARGESEENCVCNADRHTDEHGDIAFYSEIEEDSFLYPEDGIQ